MTARLQPRLLLGFLAALTALPASGDTGQVVWAELTTVAYVSTLRQPAPRLGLGASFSQPLGSARPLAPWSIQAGLRAALPSTSAPLPLELYVRPQLRAELGWWEPAVGLELGVSGLTGLMASRTSALDFHNLVQGLISPFYLAFTIAPLRLRLGTFRASVLELSLGSTLWPLGAAGRLQLDLLSAGVAL